MVPPGVTYCWENSLGWPIPLRYISLGLPAANKVPRWDTSVLSTPGQMCKTAFPARVVVSEVCDGTRLSRIGMLPRTLHTILSDVPTMDSVAVDQGQALQLDHPEICHAYYECRAEVDAEFNSYGSHCPDNEHVR